MAITEAAYAEAQMEIRRLRTALENMRRECGRAWKEVDAIASERKQHARWRQELADELGETEKVRDALGRALNKADAIGEMLAAVVQGAKEEFVRAPYGASHEDVAAINDWHKMAAEALAAWENKTC